MLSQDEMGRITTDLAVKIHEAVVAFVKPKVEANEITMEATYNIVISALTYELITDARRAGIADEQIEAALKTCLGLTPRES